MTTDSLNDYSTTPGSNTNIAGTDISVGCPPQDVGTFMRTIMAQIAYAVQGSGGAAPNHWNIGQDGTVTAQTVRFGQFNPGGSAASGHISLPGGFTLMWGFDQTDGAGNRTITWPVTLSAMGPAFPVAVSPVAANKVKMTIGTLTVSNGAFQSTDSTNGAALGSVVFFWFGIGKL